MLIVYRAGCRASLIVSALTVVFVGTAMLAADSGPPEERAKALEKEVGQGALRIVQPDGGIVECPLKHTDVQAEVAGFIARVRVSQTFHNPTKEKIEAVYVFPLPHEAAVDEMTMLVGERKIVGLIKRRDEARSIYEQALLAGQTAALLEQERPNIFTQSVGNIAPGQEVKIEIAYVDVLRYDMGTYEFHFPMVIGPRYIPGSSSGSPEPRPAGLQGKVSPPVANTDRVPDASRISPPVLKPGVRNGHDISLRIQLDAGVPIQTLNAANHQAEIGRNGERKATIELHKQDSIPNKDFVLRYGVVGKKPEMAMLGHTGDHSGDRQKLGNGYFMLMIQPQDDERLTKSPPREIVFLVDVSGSMSGEPTAKVIDAMQGMLKLCRPQDTLQVITFASHAQKLFEGPVPVTDGNIGKALNFTSGLRGGGGTEMLKGVKLAIDEPIDKERLRIVVMLTDGYIGNEAEIIEHVGKHCGDQIRFWCVGIGSSPNMFLVDGVARQGGGMGKKLGLQDQSQPLVQEIMTRIQRAQLAKLQIDWGDLKVSETYPAKLPELWAGRPVIVYGRHAGGGRIAGNIWQAEIKVSGSVEGEAMQWPLTVHLPVTEPANDVLAKVWARQKIEDLMQQSFYQGSPAVEEMVTAMALDYKLMSQYTSFVAVDSQQVDTTQPARPPRRMLVPVPLPEGTRWEGFFGEQEGRSDNFATAWGYRAGAERKKALDGLVRRSLQREETVHRLYARSPMPAGQPAAATARFGGIGLEGIAGGGIGGGGFVGRVPAKGQVQQALRAGGIGRPMAGAGRGLALGESLSKLSVADDAPADRFDGELAYSQAAIAPQGGKLAEAARTLTSQETKASDVVDHAELERLLRVCMLDTAASNLGHSDGSVAAEAMEQLEKLHAQQIQAWSKGLPQLGQRLDLVLRDQSLDQALAQVAGASKLSIRLLDGSLDDVAALLDSGALRVNYLDLRRATVAQSLDWILQPARMTWWLEGTTVVAGTARSREGNSGWVYDVSAIALPLLADLEKANDYQKAVAESQKAANEFIAAIRQSLKVDDETTVAWFGPGQLLVFGTPERHAAVAKLIGSFKGGDFRPREVPGPFIDLARKRFTARKEQLAKAEAAQRKYEVAAAHDQFGWQLLAAAAAGQLDLEALTELQIAWKSPQTAELLEGPARGLLLRSLWTICEAARALPQQPELAELAANARKEAQRVVEKPLESLKQNTADQPALISLIYAALANPGDAAYRSRAKPWFAKQTGEDPASDLRTLARLLLDKPTDADRKVLAEIVARKVAGADQTALVALASRKLGGPHWTLFRSEARDLLGSQPIPGELVALINRLDQSQILGREVGNSVRPQPRRSLARAES